MLLDRLKEYDVVLASNSPRRSELLKELGIDFRKEVFPVEELYDDTLNAVEVAEYLAWIKGATHKDSCVGNKLVISSDTVVECDGVILEKPSGREDAIGMLQRLSGHTHRVVTGVSLLSADRSHKFSEITEVTFRSLSDDEIVYYVDNYSPFDKAGGYGIQEWIGSAAVSSISGCFYNVMGLPTSRLYSELDKFIK